MRALECESGEKQVQALQDVVVYDPFLTGRIHKIKALRRENCSSGHEAVHQMNEKKNPNYFQPCGILCVIFSLL